MPGQLLDYGGGYQQEQNRENTGGKAVVFAERKLRRRIAEQQGDELCQQDTGRHEQ